MEFSCTSKKLNKLFLHFFTQHEPFFKNRHTNLELSHVTWMKVSTSKTNVKFIYRFLIIYICMISFTIVMKLHVCKLSLTES